MSSSSPYIKQLEKQIISLLTEKNYKKAYEKYQILAEKFPMSREVYKIREKIDNEISNENKDKIERKLKSLKQLWKENNYSQIIKELKPFFEIGKNNKKFIETYQKAQDLYRKTIENNQKNFRKNQDKKLAILLKNDAKEFLMELFQLEKNNPGNTFIRNLVKDYRSRYIQREIGRYKHLIAEEKFEVLDKIITGLKKVDRKNYELILFEKEVKNYRYTDQKGDKQESIYEGVNNLKTLIKIKKYAKAVKAANEIIRADKENKEAQSLLKKSEIGLSKQTREQTINLILEKNIETKLAYMKNKKSFIKI